MVEAPVPETQKTPPPKNKRIVLLAGLMLSLVVIVLIVVALFRYKHDIAYLYNGYTFPSELRTFSFISNDPYSGGLITWQKGGFDIYRTPDATIIDASKVSGVEAVIIKNAEESYEIRVNGNIVLDSASRKKDIAVSPDGTRVLFSEATGAETLSVSSWKTILYSLSEGVQTEIPNAFTSYFIHDTKLLLLTPEGLVAKDIVDDTETLILAYSFTNPLVKTALSESGTTFAFEDTGSRYTFVYKGMSGPGSLFSAERAYPIPISSSFAVNDETIFFLEQENDTTIISSYRFESLDKTLAFSLFKGLRPVQIVQ